VTALLRAPVYPSAPVGALFAPKLDRGNGRVEEVTEHGELLATLGSLGFGPGQLESPSGVAVNSNGNVWVSEESGLHVEKWTGVP
jgi:hypothetical protein